MEITQKWTITKIAISYSLPSFLRLLTKQIKGPPKVSLSGRRLKKSGQNGHNSQKAYKFRFETVFFRTEMKNDEQRRASAKKSSGQRHLATSPAAKIYGPIFPQLQSLIFFLTKWTVWCEILKSNGNFKKFEKHVLRNNTFHEPGSSHNRIKI